MTRPPRAPQFGVLSTIGGFDVIDLHTGRTVAQRETRRSASGTARKMNQAAWDGGKVFERAMGVREDPEQGR